MRYHEIKAGCKLFEAARYNHSTGDMEITFDPATISIDDFKAMVSEMRRMRPYTLGYAVNEETFDNFDAASRKILELMRPRIEAYQQRQEEKRTAWARKHPELINIVDMVPTRWLAQLRGNDLRDDVSDLMADIDQKGILWPVIIAVGQKDRRARIAEGNHRIAAAIQLGLESIPAMVHIGTNGRGAQQYSYDVSDDLLIPPDEYVPSEMKPSKVFRSLATV